MIDALIKRIHQLEREGVRVPVHSDSDGYFDRECPAKNCLFEFKVFKDDWDNLCKDDAIHCPFCGHTAPSNGWWTQRQLKEAKDQAMGQVSNAIHEGLSASARVFNRNQRRGFVSISMKLSKSSGHHIVIPIRAEESMELKISCNSCSTRFAVVGSAFFCPCCGLNSVERTFTDSLKKVEAKLDNLTVVRNAVAQANNKDDAEEVCRSLIETGINDCVVAFQKLSESLYSRIPQAKKPAMNTFQRIDDGSEHWRLACGQGYEDWLDGTEIEDLKLLFSKRHLLSHTEGFVDEKYLRQTNDNTYAIGQRIVVKENDVRRMVELVRILENNIRTKTEEATLVRV